MIYKKNISKQILFVVAFLATLLISWNNTKSLRSKDSTGTETNSQHAELKHFPVLRILKTDIINLFASPSGPSVYKLVFKFNINNHPDSLNPSLTAFRAKRNGRRYIPGVPKTLWRTSKTCEITGEYTVGNLEIHKNDWGTVLSNAEQGDTYLYFYPKKQLQNGVYSIVYVLFWGGDMPPVDDCPKEDKKGDPKILGEDGALNPSPPADPR